MEMTVRQEERCLEIALIGELDHHAAREIGGRLNRVRDLGGAVTLRGVRPQARKVLDAAGLDRFVTVE